MNELHQIPGNPNYFINKMGEVWSDKTNTLLKMKLSSDGGYATVGLCNKTSVVTKVRTKTKTTRHRVHRLMGYTFLGLDITNPNSQINHINHDRKDNILSNLEVVSSRKNSVHRYTRVKTTSNYPGVSVYLSRSKTWDRVRYVATMVYKNKINYLGRFENELEAANAYQIASAEAEAGTYIHQKGRFTPVLKKRSKERLLIYLENIQKRSTST